MDYFNDILSGISKLSPEMFTIVIIIALGYIPRILPVTNKIIPWACIIVAPFIYPLLTNPGRVSPDKKYPLLWEIGTGFLLGLLAWIAHDKAIWHLERWLVNRFGNSGSKRYRKTATGSFEEVRAEIDGAAPRP